MLPTSPQLSKLTVNNILRLFLSMLQILCSYLNVDRFIVSPLGRQGNPVQPRLLQKYVKTHHCPVPTCACDIPCRFVAVKTGEFAGKSAIACGAGYGCSYWGAYSFSLLCSLAPIHFAEFSIGHRQLARCNRRSFNL